MSNIRLLAEELQLSRVTVSAALRGLPWVKLTTRDRVLRRAEQRGVALATKADATTGILGIVRIKGHAQRGRAAVERQRAIGRAARGAAYEAGYRVEEIVICAEDLNTLPAVLSGPVATDCWCFRCRARICCAEFGRLRFLAYTRKFPPTA